MRSTASIGACGLLPSDDSFPPTTQGGSIYKVWIAEEELLTAMEAERPDLSRMITDAWGPS